METTLAVLGDDRRAPCAVRRAAAGSRDSMFVPDSNNAMLLTRNVSNFFDTWENQMEGQRSFVIAFACMVAMVLGSVGIADQSSDAAGRQGKTLVTRSYRTADLPIWTEGGKGFDHSILIALIRANIGDDAWDESHSIAPYPQSVSLVVSTTKENHDVIAKTLDQLRMDRFKRSPDFRRSTE